ncbi:uncharacterized protein BT62DRAFT_1013781 [Guyanagaster necrorhizus]|uniref:Uncharacterized protein n=1 Tax=Guyanagaster necrorhizus TaxID=856835 RepID=A0A9P7VFD3_9AGAR|nr:uncharacterized protein BT62DRAFT_1013781 [Guyanagaster necrorhizus MCA 3950]KAG7439557.1 hypothetical protein BT62DRAFT_1013781 [Guyanagaster necrorhizus MCA 3950]
MGSERVKRREGKPSDNKRHSETQSPKEWGQYEEHDVYKGAFHKFFDRDTHTHGGKKKVDHSNSSLPVIKNHGWRIEREYEPPVNYTRGSSKTVGRKIVLGISMAPPKGSAVIRFSYSNFLSLPVEATAETLSIMRKSSLSQAAVFMPHCAFLHRRIMNEKGRY